VVSIADIQRIKDVANDKIAGEINALDAGRNEVRRLQLTFGQVRCVLEAAAEFTPAPDPAVMESRKGMNE